MSERLRHEASEYFPIPCPQSCTRPPLKTVRRKYVPVIFVTVIEHTRPIRTQLFKEHRDANHVGDVVPRVGQICWTIVFAHLLFSYAISSPFLSDGEQFLNCGLHRFCGLEPDEVLGIVPPYGLRPRGRSR